MAFGLAVFLTVFVFGVVAFELVAVFDVDFAVFAFGLAVFLARAVVELAVIREEALGFFGAAFFLVFVGSSVWVAIGEGPGQGEGTADCSPARNRNNAPRAAKMPGPV